jgi:hypothetical protein
MATLADDRSLLLLSPAGGGAERLAALKRLVLDAASSPLSR